MFKNYKRLPTDSNGTPCSSGTAGFSLEFIATGDFQEIKMPINIECKMLTISCRDNNNTYDHLEFPIEFHFSFNKDGSAWDYTSRVSLNLAKSSEEVIGYVRASSGINVIVTGLF